MKKRLNKAVTTLVGPDAKIMGNLLFGSGCHVAGVVQGDVLPTEGDKTELTVAESGRIEGNALSANMLIEGTVQGDLTCKGVVSLSGTARVEGSIEYGEIEIEKGALVKGSLNRMAREAPEAAAGESRFALEGGEEPGLDGEYSPVAESL